MDKNVTTIFLSMALTIAFTRLVGSTNPTIGMWAIFLYFVFRKISYYVCDIRFSELSANIFKQETTTERMFNLFLGVSTLFMFIVSGYFVIQIDAFFLWQSLALLFNIGWVILLLILIDPVKDKNPKLTVRRMFRNFIIINSIEMIIFLVGGLWLSCKWVINGISDEVISKWILGIVLGTLSFIMLIDFLLHKYFLFDPTYKCD
jgi:hypothetical protein